ncbi:MAG TPA: ABC transporter permease [Candidatus Limnocylindrales bacterium]|nr:ABC transporter permease [Candidatus Limnocylindrales bacterium]
MVCIMWIHDIWAQLKELYKFRSLIQSLVIRELKARYRGSILGFLWSFLNPLLLISVYTLVFSIYFRFGMDHYVVFLFSGLLPWLWFSSSLQEASVSILAGGSLVKKVLFPAEVLPIVTVLSNLVNFLLGLPILILLSLLFGFKLHSVMLVLPLIMLIQLIFTLGLALMVSALCVHFRDIQHILANVLTLWFFVTPVIYRILDIPEKWRFTIVLNPVASLIAAYHDIIYYGRAPNYYELARVAIIGIITYVVGHLIFEKLRGTFAEEI